MTRVLKFKRARRCKFWLPGALLLFTLSFALPARAELPPPSANMELIPAGSLVIAMDNDKQNIGAVFNLNAYGLANHLLWEGIRVKWAIRAGKAKDGVDFSVMAQRILPTATAPADPGAPTATAPADLTIPTRRRTSRACSRSIFTAGANIYLTGRQSVLAMIRQHGRRSGPD